MERVTGFLLAVYNFFVGDKIILGGITATFIVIGALGRGVGAPSGLTGTLLVVGVLATLGGTLWHETRATPKK